MMNNIQETHNQKNEDEFLWKMLRGTYQVAGIFFLGLAIADLIGVVDHYGREIIGRRYVEDIVPLYAAVAFSVGWFMIRGLEGSAQGRKVRAGFLFWITVLLIQFAVMLIYPLSVDMISYKSEVYSMCMRYYLCGLLLSAGIINYAIMRQNIREAFARKQGGPTLR